jgi:hypothetical protein
MASAFMNSADFQSSAKCIEFLRSKGVDIHPGMTEVVPAAAFHGMYFTKENVKKWDKKDSAEELRKKLEMKAEIGWNDWLAEEVDRDWRDIFQEMCELMNDFVGYPLRTNKPENHTQYVKIHSKSACEFIIKTLKEEKERRRREIVGEVSKGTKKASSAPRREKRTDSEYEIVYTNEKTIPQGEDYEYYLDIGEVEDSEALVEKDGKIQKGAGRDGKDLKKRTWKAVKREQPFLCEGKCCGAICWDRAGGSKVLEHLGIKGSFRMGCSSDRVDGSMFCGKCDGKAENVFEATYKTGKLKGKTYAQVIVQIDELSETALAPVEDGYEGGAEYAKMMIGDRWVDTDL